MQVPERLHPGYGITLVRIVAGIILLLAGFAKWTGPGVAGVTGFFANEGIPVPAVMAPLLMAFEGVGGLLLIFGAFSRVIGAVMIVQFLVAALVVSLPSQTGERGAARLPVVRVRSAVPDVRGRMALGRRRAGRAPTPAGRGRFAPVLTWAPDSRSAWL